MSLLTDYIWERKYDADGRSLVERFYVPILESAVRYDRTTGYFSPGVLLLASRGVEGLDRNGGRMRLVVGCSLEQEEVDAITRGEELKHVVEAQLAKAPLTPGTDEEHQALELLSWLIARGMLEIRVAIPCDEHRRPRASRILFHEKAGIVEDRTGRRLAFNGSINETIQGWQDNWESFHVFTSWASPGDEERVSDEEKSFERLWRNEAKRCVVIDVPAAVRDGLLKFLPPDDQLPARLLAMELPPPDPAEPVLEPGVRPPTLPSRTLATTDEAALRREVWAAIAAAPTWRAGGERIGEATCNVTPWPHQVRAFNRLYSSWPPKLLIADEVGLGKTIQAGLLLRQAWLSGLARRILVLAPKAVLTQWQLELREKFNLNWPIYDGANLRWCESPATPGGAVRKVPDADWHKEPVVIASSHLLRRTDRAPQVLEAAEPWDLVVLDEAHHARRKGAGTTKDRKPNQLLALMQQLRARTQGLLLLTATPMQVSPVEVWDLLDLLGLPEGWDEQAFVAFFDRAAHPNPSASDFEFLADMFRKAERRFGPVDEGVVRRCMPEGTGSLAARKVVRALRDEAVAPRRQLSTEHRRAAVHVMQAATPVARLISRHTRELLRRYFKAGKITTRIADRNVEDVFVTMSADERAVYEGIEDYISTAYANASLEKRNAVGFIMTVYRKRVASSFAALRQTLMHRLTDPKDYGTLFGDEDAPEDEAGDEALEAADLAALARDEAVAEDKARIEEILAAVRALPPDTKTTQLVDVLRGLQARDYRQVIVFTQFTDTLDYLRDHLHAAGFSVLCYSGRGGERREASGTWRHVSRDDTKRMFRQGDADILLCTDAAAEGLNFQFCGALVNYDMPWNPMRVEQRIGRIDRLGQAFSEIRILNLHYEDTVETDVYKALRDRIQLFSQFVGKLQPILARLPKQLKETTLMAPRASREHQRDALVQNIDQDVKAAEAQAFDLDAITAGDIDEPVRPSPYYDLDDLDLLIRRPELLPPGVEVQAMGPREYSYSQPGMASPRRVTTSRAYYDDHPSSLELWSPGNPLFPTDVVHAAAAENPPVRLRDLLQPAAEGGNK